MRIYTPAEARHKPHPLPKCNCGGRDAVPHEWMSKCPKCGGLRPNGSIG